MADNDFRNIVVHHGGMFNHPKKRKGKSRKYVGGKLTEIELDQDRVSYVSFLEVLMSICDLPEGFFLTVSYESLNFNDSDPFEIVSNDKELMEMFEATSDLPNIHLYVSLEHTPPPIRNVGGLNPVGGGTIDEDDLANQVDSFHGGDVSSKLGGAARDSDDHRSEGKREYNIRTSSSDNGYCSEVLLEDTIDRKNSVFQKAVEFSNIKQPINRIEKTSSPGSSFKSKVSKQIKTPTRVSKRIKSINESFSSATESRIDLPHPNDPEVVEMIDIEEMTPKISRPVMPVTLVNLEVGCADMVSKQRIPPHGSKCAEVGAESFVPVTKNRVDLCHPNNPGDVGMVDRQETNPKIPVPVVTLTSVNSVVGHATCTTEEPSGSLPTSEEQVATMEMAVEFPDAIHQALTSVVKQLTNELKSTPVESLGDKMRYFHDHVVWFAHVKFPVEEFKQNLNCIFPKYREKIARLLEIEVELSELKKVVVELDRKMSELHQKVEKLRSEEQSLLWGSVTSFTNSGDSENSETFIGNGWPIYYSARGGVLPGSYLFGGASCSFILCKGKLHLGDRLLGMHGTNLLDFAARDHFLKRCCM